MRDETVEPLGYVYWMCPRCAVPVGRGQARCECCRAAFTFPETCSDCEDAFDALRSRAEAAEAEVARLRAVLSGLASENAALSEGRGDVVALANSVVIAAALDRGLFTTLKAAADQWAAQRKEPETA